MSAFTEEQVEKWSRIWRVLHPTLSWTVGVGLFVFTTVTGAGNQSAEWYALIGGLIGGPFITIWKENQKKKGPPSNGGS